MSLEPFVTAAELRAALSLATYLALFDDEQTGSTDIVDASLPVTLTLSRAHVRVVSWLPNSYSTNPTADDSDVSVLLKDAELNYAVGMAFDRHPEYSRQYGEDPRRKAAFDQAELTMTRVQSAVLRLVDSPSLGIPALAGGVCYESGPRTITDSLDGTHNGGDL